MYLTLGKVSHILPDILWKSQTRPLLVCSEDLLSTCRSPPPNCSVILFIFLTKPLNTQVPNSLNKVKTMKHGSLLRHFIPHLNVFPLVSLFLSISILKNLYFKCPLIDDGVPLQKPTTMHSSFLFLLTLVLKTLSPY